MSFDLKKKIERRFSSIMHHNDFLTHRETARSVLLMHLRHWLVTPVLS